MTKTKSVLLVASGDLRQSANETCWPAQHAVMVEEVLARYAPAAPVSLGDVVACDAEARGRARALLELA